MAVNGCTWFEMAGHGWNGEKDFLRNKLDIAGIAENGWKQMEIAGNFWNGLKWLNITEKS